MWLPEITANGVLAFATLVYGGAATGLWLSSRHDRKQREEHFRKEQEDRKREKLYSAFYDAWGYWQGHLHRSGDSRTDALQAGRVFEAMIRLECELRLNGFKKEAHNLGAKLRMDIHGIDQPLSEVGLALGILPETYREVHAVVLPNKPMDELVRQA